MDAKQYMRWLVVIAGLIQGVAISSPVLTCVQVTGAQPREGARYVGLVVNDDYRMRVRVPKGLVGWGAAVFPDGTGAPFHGFALFPSASNSACIVVSVGWRVEEGEAPVRPEGAQAIPMHGAMAWAEEVSGNAGGQSLFNHTVTFSAVVGNSSADGSVQIIGPTAERERLIDLGNQVIRSMAFHP